ncbi:hypothetical protein HMPREF0518_1978 [Lactobacillus helveticus DSM 20075 = CGMCC 1.1877]|nr:hypothetical protein HMPREF0518_1978 [Lactobacillus helveticus DSM 20075 = CGMCC 1.1877]
MAINLISFIFYSFIFLLLWLFIDYVFNSNSIIYIFSIIEKHFILNS